MKFSQHLVFSAALAIAILPAAAGSAHAQELSEDDLQAILEGRTFEVGRTRVAEPAAAPTAVTRPAVAQPARTARPDSAAPSAASGDVPLNGSSLFDAVSQAVAESGAPVGMGLGGGVAGGLARSLMGLAGGTGDTGEAGGPSGLENMGLGLTRSLLDAASGVVANGGGGVPLPGGASMDMMQQLGQMMGVPAPEPPTPAPGSVGGALDGARALLDAYSAARSTPIEDIQIDAPAAAMPTTPEAAATAEATPARVAPTRQSVRAAPARPGSRSRDEEEDGDAEDRALPWASGFSGAQDDADSAIPPRARRNIRRAAPAPAAARAASTAGAVNPAATTDTPPVQEERRPTPPPRPVEVERPAAGAAAPVAADPAMFEIASPFEQAVASREGDWFVVLGSYRVRPGQDPLPSPDVNGSVERSESAWIAGAQERLWDAGVVPYVVRSDAVPGFEDGLAVIVVGPLARTDAIAELSELREVVPDAYIKEGW